MNAAQRLHLLVRQDADLFALPILLGRYPSTVVGYRSLVDVPASIILLQSQARSSANGQVSPERWLDALGEVLPLYDEARIKQVLRGGMLIVAPEGDDLCAVAIAAPRTLTRSIEAPTTENVMRGSISAFNEEMDTNIGLIKKHVNSENLRTKSYSLGTEATKRSSLIYIEGRISPDLLSLIERKLEENASMEANDLQELSKLLGFTTWTLVAKFHSTELPQDAAIALRNGKAVLLLDRFPFALIMPSLLWEMFIVENDRNFPLPIMFLVRALRVLGVLANIVMPGLYVALVSVNPDVLRIELALSIAQSRFGVPYPAFVETFLLLVILELILEASVRLPKSIGPTITMVGGIILGQAVVAANLVSNLLIIILAATTIASSTAVGFHNSITIRVFKYLVVCLSAVYGVLGLFSGIVIVSAYLSSLTTFGVPYLYIRKSKENPHG